MKLEVIKGLLRLVAWFQLQFPSRGGFGDTADSDDGAGA